MKEGRRGWGIDYLLQCLLSLLIIMIIIKKKTIIKNAKINQKIMIHRREFDDKLTKEFLMIVHCNLQISIRLILFSKDVKVDQSFSSSGSLFHKLAALDINERCPYDCLILGNFKFLLLFLVSQPYHRAASLIAQKCPDLLNVVKEDGFSALHLASLNGHHSVVQCLVEVRKLTYFLCCVRCNGVILLILSCIFAHTLPAAAQIFCNKRKLLNKKRVQLPKDWFGSPIWSPFYFFLTPTCWAWRHDVKTLFSNFSKSLVITMSPLKFTQSERLEISGERLLLL